MSTLNSNPNRESIPAAKKTEYDLVLPENKAIKFKCKKKFVL